MLLDRYDKAETLLGKNDPESEPYKSKYESRNILSEIIFLLHQNEGNEGFCLEHSRTVEASVYCLLGCIDMEVQELAQGEKDLLASLKCLEDVKGQEFVILTAVKASNQLGILWCMRDDHEKAKLYLDEANIMYEKFMDRHKNMEECCDRYNNLGIYGLRDLLQFQKGTSNVPNTYEKEKALDLLNAYTYYYLAQVYQKLEEPKKSAQCCHKTLSKQLELKEYQAMEWATNSATLSHHYIAHENFQAAKIHLAAATYVMERYKQDLESREFGENEEGEKEELLETLRKCEADIARSWGKYTLVLLQVSMDHILDDESPNSGGSMLPGGTESMRVEDIEQGDNTVTSPSENEVAESHDFPSIEMDPDLMAISSNICKSFEESRAIFLPGQRFFNKAKTIYYTLHEHCTDYAEINQDLSQMHKVLIHFEEDPDRQFKMHKRRVDLLEEISNELNISVYKLLVRQVLFEVAEIYSAMMDIKLEKWRKIQDTSRGTDCSALANKINAVIRLSINNFKAFQETLKNSDGSGFPETFSEDTVRPALLSHFHMGRLCDKYVGIPEISQEKLKNKLESYCHFKTIVDYCAKHDDMEQIMANELPLCKELVQLLPVKIQRMKRELDLQPH